MPYLLATTDGMSDTSNTLINRSDTEEETTRLVYQVPGHGKHYGV